MKRIIIRIIDILVKLWYKIRDTFWAIHDFFYTKIHKPPVIASVSETIDEIINNGCSISRYGDAEIKLVAGKDISYQVNSPFITKKMREVLSSDIEGLLIALADAFGKRDRYNDAANKYWNKHLSRYRSIWYKYLIKGKKYYNASMTRQYISLRNKEESGEIFEHIKKIWDDRNVVIIEGEKSRLGVGNDLFDNAASIKRILGPSSQAFSKYDELLEEAKKIDKDSLVLLALGPVATCLAYDLHKLGYQAVDIGHVDVEYEWYKMNAQKRMPVKNKMVYEAVTGEIGDSHDPKYESQIIAKIL